MPPATRSLKNAREPVATARSPAVTGTSTWDVGRRTTGPPASMIWIAVGAPTDGGGSGTVVLPLGGGPRNPGGVRATSRARSACAVSASSTWPRSSARTTTYVITPATSTVIPTASAVSNPMRRRSGN